MVNTKTKADELTTIGLSPADRDAIRAFAEARGMKIRHVSGLLLEGWGLLSPGQQDEAMHRYFQSREASRRQPTSA